MNPRDPKIGIWTAVMITAVMAGGCASRPTPPPVEAPVASKEPAVMTVGAERAALPVRAPGGNGVPLRKAVEQLVPPDYSVRWVGVDASRLSAPVSWGADQSWADALEEALNAVPGVAVTIATGSRLVLVRVASNDLRPLPKPTAKTTSAVTTGQAARSLKTKDRAKGRVNPESAGGNNPAMRPVAMEVDALPAPATSEAVVLERVSVHGTKTAAREGWVLQTEDQTLRGALDRWSREAGWKMFWEMGVDYPIVAPADVEGNFEDAIAVVVRSLSQADVPPKAVFYRGNRVLRVIPRGKE
ncbi:Toxin co-regulated pilus biosynthesis protein Q [Roseateles sp. YR242]|nr:Toxin co-regulated pilus biosynthesis protein Q [Roseateles sp. YR242]